MKYLKSTTFDYWCRFLEFEQLIVIVFQWKIVITKRKAKYVDRVLNSSKTWTSIMMACSSEGKLLPPYVVYKAKHIYNTWVAGGPSGTRYNRTISGWFYSETFFDWVEKILIPHLRRMPGLLPQYLFNFLTFFHSSQVKKLSLAITRAGISLLKPSNCAKFTSSFYPAIQRTWYSRSTSPSLHPWNEAGASFSPSGNKEKDKIKQPSLNDRASASIINGFRKCGLYPTNRTTPQPAKKRGRPPAATRRVTRSRAK